MAFRTWAYGLKLKGLGCKVAGSGSGCRVVGLSCVGLSLFGAQGGGTVGGGWARRDG